MKIVKRFSVSDVNSVNDNDNCQEINTKLKELKKTADDIISIIHLPENRRFHVFYKDDE